jgi:hypothetical protein
MEPALAFPERQSGRAFRFQLVGSDHRCSTVYSIFVAKKTPDVYITPMMMGGEMKISLHKSGSWQAGLTTEVFAKLPLTESRHWDIWPRDERADVAPGVTLAWYLRIAEQELRGGRDDPNAFKVPAVGGGHAAVIRVLMVSDNGPPLLLEPGHPIGKWRLSGLAESCLLHAQRIPWSFAQQERANATRKRLAAIARAGGVERSPDHAYFVHGQTDLGIRFGIELAADQA